MRFSWLAMIVPFVRPDWIIIRSFDIRLAVCWSRKRKRVSSLRTLDTYRLRLFRHVGDRFAKTLGEKSSLQLGEYIFKYLAVYFLPRKLEFFH